MNFRWFRGTWQCFVDFMFSVVQLPAAGQLNSADNGNCIAGRRAMKNLDFVGFVVPVMLLATF